MAVAVEDVLAKAGLDKFTGNFTSQGFTTGESLMLLTMQDYGKFGVVQTEDRRKLFQIIQQQKQVKTQDPGTNKRMSSVIARLTSSEKRSKEKRDAPADPTPPNSMYFNRATFLRRSFNKQKGSDTEPAMPKPQQSMRERRATAGSTKGSSTGALNRKGSLSASAENINKYRNCQNSENGSSPLRKSASGRTDFNHRVKNDDAPVPRIRSKTTSIISSSQNSPRRTLKTSDKIRVCIRKRPLNKKERTRSEDDIINMMKPNELTLLETKTSVDCTKYMQKHCYVFDSVFDETSNNEEVYEGSAKPLVDWIFQGNKATCFAYGQTGSGKTFTMTGTKSIEGIVMLAAKDIFKTIASRKYGDDFNVFVSFYEIYCGQLFDLINKRKRLNALENAKKAICIVGLEEKQVFSHKDIIDLVNQGGHRRSSGSTSVNTESSRSHAILQVELKSSTGKPRGKFSFIDLAGSERAADVSDSNKQTRLEGAEINTSLLALKECIRALDQESKHTPFRQSKLTQVLRDSFLGNSKTCMIASISPNVSSCEDTLNTLRYADRVKELGREGPAPAPDPSLLSVTSLSDHLPSEISLLDRSDDENEYLAAVDDSIANIEQIEQTDTQTDTPKPDYIIKSKRPRHRQLPTSPNGKPPRAATTVENTWLRLKKHAKQIHPGPSAQNPQPPQNTKTRARIASLPNKRRSPPTKTVSPPKIQTPVRSPTPPSLSPTPYTQPESYIEPLIVVDLVQSESDSSEVVIVKKTKKSKKKKKEKERENIVHTPTDEDISSLGNTLSTTSKRFRQVIRTSSGEENEAPVQKQSKGVSKVNVSPATPIIRSSTPPKKTPSPPVKGPRAEYPRPPATAPPKVQVDASDTETQPSGAWMERSKTMASSPRTRKVKPEDKMRKAQDDLVASHQIHISQVTNLCSLEAELLQTFVDGDLEFPEYMKKLESILESKNKCVESLRAQVACYSLRATY